MNVILAKRLTVAGIILTITVAALGGFQPTATGTSFAICIILGFAYGVLTGIETSRMG